MQRTPGVRAEGRLHPIGFRCDVLVMTARILSTRSTLLLRVPVALGAAHQGGAVLVLATSLWFAHALRRTAQ